MCAVLNDTRLTSLRSSVYATSRLTSKHVSNLHEQKKSRNHETYYVYIYIYIKDKGDDALLLRRGGGRSQSSNLNKTCYLLIEIFSGSLEIISFSVFSLSMFLKRQTMTALCKDSIRVLPVCTTVAAP